ncbi:MAG: SUMF1/EgtB/PvdO family nonheme iron enzyme [Deltaproteobacteria bacterium]|nr:SUMF1/EgtB/PvdO family nonheme iron enzyme [Deltaproteobacteria bacterium]MBK8238088.1 SUMF1/EgtB/PvdO family nonheme iron enzyme [Deltaproteobacteria bacterium]MBK8718567.1 SUMF1/EgtB/PvdO family nonheme iron enzyme [Deltaproteobacteria bacterium]MBP7290826.1 SUMF1/EgtB/PvdO family nonheme iron enzyme [Nannocystaceae bacterium]
MRITLALLLAVATCDGRSPSAPSPEPAAATPAKGDAPAPIAIEASPAPPAAPAAAAAPAATPAALPVAPDGTAMLPCPAGSPDDMACIPGGPFIRGADDGPENARPAATVWAQTFFMDRHEVTYAQYNACMKEKGCPKARPRYTDYDHPNMPMTGVSWFDAVEYCRIMGKHLPSEAQWEKAARGPDGARYPWGNDPVTCERAIYRDASGRGCGLKKQFSKPETGRPWDVGSRPAGVYDLFDMVGNSWEWVADWNSKSWASCGADCEGLDPKGPCADQPTCATTRNKIVRGGSWYWEDEKATGIYRRAHVPSNDPFHHFGFRCAASLDEAAALDAAK